VFFQGQSLAELTLEERVMCGMALVPERRELFGTMSVEDNLVLGGYRQMRLGHAQWRDRLDDVYTLFPRLKERRVQEAGTLSGGERQMLAVGRSLMSRPSLLMLDEPSLGLAPLIVSAIYQQLKVVGQTLGASILVVEQNARLALDFANTAYVIERGVITLSGTAAEVASSDVVRESYLGASREGSTP